MAGLPQSDVDQAADQPADEPGDESVATYRRGHPVRWIALGVGIVVFLTLGVIVGQRITDGATEADSPLLGKPAPAFDLPRIDAAGRVQSTQLLGRVTIINFWASWCVPCRKENAVLDDFYQRWQPRGIELVGILYGDTVDAGRAFRAELGGTWPLVDDPNGSTSVAYGITGVPETFIIDASGIIVAKLIGAVGPTTLDEILAQLAGGTPTVTYTNIGDYRQAPGTP